MSPASTASLGGIVKPLIKSVATKRSLPDADNGVLPCKSKVVREAVVAADLSGRSLSGENVQASSVQKDFRTETGQLNAGVCSAHHAVSYTHLRAHET